MAKYIKNNPAIIGAFQEFAAEIALFLQQSRPAFLNFACGTINYITGL